MERSCLGNRMSHPLLKVWGQWTAILRAEKIGDLGRDEGCACLSMSPGPRGRCTSSLRKLDCSGMDWRGASELQGGWPFLPQFQSLGTDVFWKGADMHRKEQPRRIKAQEIKALRRECSPGRDSDSSQQTQGAFKTNRSTSSVSGQEYLLQSSMLSCLNPGF